MKKIICWLVGHKRGKTFYKGKGIWHVECRRCGFTLEYESPMARLVGTEIKSGFDGE